MRSMPLCEGRPEEPCPERRNDTSVKLSKGDLMLCTDCEIFRFPYLASKSAIASATTADNAKSCSNSGRSGESADGSDTLKRPIILNDLLCFVQNKVHNFPAGVIKSTIAEFYHDDEVLGAKQSLLKAVNEKAIPALQQFTKKRVGENKIKSTVDDIMNIWSTLDENDLLSKIPTFCSCDTSRIAVIPDELTDLVYLRKTIVELKQVQELTDIVLQLSNQRIKTKQHTNGQANEMLAAADQSLVQRSGIVSNGAEVLNKASVSAATTSKHSAEVRISPQDASADEQPLQHQSSLSSVGPDYADAVKRDTNTGWQRVKTAKRKPKNKIVIGESKSSCTFQGVSKKSVVCVNRLHPSTTAEMISDFLQSSGIDVVSCYLLNRDEQVQRKFTSVRLCVPQPHLAKILDHNFWPFGVIVRPWVFKEPKSN